MIHFSDSGLLGSYLRSFSFGSNPRIFSSDACSFLLSYDRIIFDSIDLLSSRYFSLLPGSFLIRFSLLLKLGSFCLLSIPSCELLSNLLSLKLGCFSSFGVFGRLGVSFGRILCRERCENHLPCFCLLGVFSCGNYSLGLLFRVLHLSSALNEGEGV